MVITSIERSARRRGHVDVYVDGVRTVEVERRALGAYRLRPGRPIDAAEVDAIAVAESRRAALEAALAMLARRPRSERDVRQRLARRGCAPSLVDETIARLAALKLLDDAAYARAWVESRLRSSPRGRRLLVQELRAHGVARPQADDAAATVADEDAAYGAAARRLRSLAGLDYAAFRDRLGAHLQRRGFGWDVCRATVDRCWRESGGAPVDDDLTDGVR